MYGLCRYKQALTRKTFEIKYNHLVTLVLNTQNHVILVSCMQFDFSVRASLDAQTEKQTKRQQDKNVFFFLYIREENKTIHKHCEYLQETNLIFFVNRNRRVIRFLDRHFLAKCHDQSNNAINLVTRF